MTCEQVQHWLLEAESPAAPAPEVRRHLQDCPVCRRQQQALLLLEQQVRELPPPPENAAALGRFWQKWERQSAPRGLRVYQSQKAVWLHRNAKRLAVAAVAAALLLALGLSWWFWPPNPETPGQPAPLASPEVRENQFVARVVEHDLRIAEAVNRQQRFAALNELTAELRVEAQRLANHASKYAAVVKRLSAFTETRLKQEEKVALSPPPAPDLASAVVLLEVLVVQGVRLAEEDDPLRRADYCNEIADHLVRAIVSASQNGDAEHASQLGNHLGQFMDRGVANNLARVEMDEKNEAQQLVFVKVSEHTDRTSEVLQKNLERAPPPAQEGLKRALEASKHGLKKAAEVLKEKGKGKGKPTPHDKRDDKEKGKPGGPPDRPKPPELPKKPPRDEKDDDKGKPGPPEHNKPPKDNEKPPKDKPTKDEGRSK